MAASCGCSGGTRTSATDDGDASQPSEVGSVDVQLENSGVRLTTATSLPEKRPEPGKPGTSAKHRCLRGVCCKGRCLACSPLCALLTPPLCFVGFLIVLAIGSAVERGHVLDAPHTEWVYETAEVCSVSNTTYGTVEGCHDDGELVRHCGACGQCSTTQDVQIYYDTLDTLTDTTTGCAFKAVLEGRGSVTRCMENRVNLTEGCTTCWVDNIMCDLKKCVFTCMLYRMGLGGSKNVEANSSQLTKCLECDEKRCGPEFIRCAGANRRRSGIQSDIERNYSHVCKKVDWGPGAGT